MIQRLSLWRSNCSATARSVAHRSLWLLALLLALPTVLHAQQLRYSISGKVLESATKQAVVGATVRIENTVLGVPTDRDGNFTLLASLSPGSYTISVSYIGFKRKLVKFTLADNNLVKLDDVLLDEDLTRAEEVVVTGTSVLTSKKEIGNAITTLNASDIDKSAATSIDQALQGKVAGALINQNSGNPGGSISIQLRGVNTVFGSAEPLYIVDGVIINNARPVLLNLGGYAQNRLVDLNPNDIERIEVVKGAAAAAIYGSRANNGVVQIFTKRGALGEPRIEFGTRVNFDNVRKTLEVNTYPFLDPVGTPNQRPTQRFNFQDFIFRQAVGTETYLSVSGGGGSTQYFLSASYLGNQGIIRSSAFQRGTIRANLDQTVNSWARLSFSASYSLSNSADILNNGASGSDGMLLALTFNNNNIDPRPDPVTGIYPRLATTANPVEIADRFVFGQVTNRIAGSLRLDVSPFEGFGADITAGFDTYVQTGTGFMPPGNTSGGAPDGFSRRATRDFRQFNLDANARYQADLQPWLKSTTVIGGTLQYERVDQLAAQTTVLAPLVQTVGAGINAPPGELRDVPLTLYGGFLQQTFGAFDKYFLTLGGRVDASSGFGVSNRWQFYPRASLSYNLSDESFWKESGIAQIINSVKLRAAFGNSGGITAIGSFDRLTLFSAVNYGGRPGLVPSTRLGTPDIQPERQREIEVGADMSFLNDRIGLEVTYYDKVNTGLLIARNLAPSTGFSTRLDNVATVTNRGIELLLRAVPVQTDNVRWETIVNFSSNRNVASNVVGGTVPLGIFNWSVAQEGQPLGIFFQNAFQRDANGNIIRSTGGPGGAGVPLRLLEPNGANAFRIIGDPNPSWTASWINQVQLIRNLTFRLQIDVLRNATVVNFTQRNLNGLGGGGAGAGRVLAGELPLGFYRNPASTPDNPGVFFIAENWMEDGSYVKIREASISYAFNDLFGIRSGSISVIGRNLFSFDNYSGFDPELNAFATQPGGVRGGDDTETPIPRSISIALRVNF